MSLKKKIGKIHLWLGLASGLVVFIVAITGCIYVFQKEISEALYPERYFVDSVPANNHTVSLSAMKQKAEQAIGEKVDFMITYKDPERNWIFSSYERGDKNGIWYSDEIKHFKVASINPYTGEVSAVTDYKYEFFNVVKYLHWSLLLSTKYGQPIVGVSTIIFVVMLITGLVLWWPKKWNKAHRDMRFKVKWKASFKRTNYDLHNVMGFYAMTIALVISLTGLVWAFKWFQSTVYAVSALSVTPPERLEGKSTKPEQPMPTNVKPMDIAFAKAQQMMPDADRIGVDMDEGDVATIDCFGYRGQEVYYDRDQLKFDQYTGNYLGRRDHKDWNNGEKLIGMNYDIHVGAVLGLPGKILAFFASFIAASLPITGFLIWYGRKYKKKAKAPVKQKEQKLYPEYSI